MDNGRKFSLFAYTGGPRRKQRDSEEIAVVGRESSSAFERLVQEIREELAAGRGMTKQDAARYQEMLNRAVLGFEEDRHSMMALIQDLLSRRETAGITVPHASYAKLSEAVFAQVVGLDVLEAILKHREGLEEIQVIGCDIYEVRNGQVMLAAERFRTVSDVERIQQNLVLYNHDTLNVRKRWAEVRLTDGSRVTMTGFGFTREPTITIRFFRRHEQGLDWLCAAETATMNHAVKILLQSFVRCAFNLVIIGATNSGKTTLLKALAAVLPDEERIVTIEGRYELMLRRDYPEKNIVEYEVDEDDPKHSSNQAFKLALRQSPKRIIHAEIRDDDANLYVRACTRGHEGSMTTLHANQLEDVPDAITDMCMLDRRGMEPGRLRYRIAEWVTQVGIELAEIGGKRRIVRVAEYVCADGEITVRDLVRFDPTTGDWVQTGTLSPRAQGRIRRHCPADAALLVEAGWMA
ncbi:CpaF family protein [Xylanibacillus composti]|nr:CpaF family protein [Xylanibacillus composti]